MGPEKMAEYGALSVKAMTGAIIVAVDPQTVVVEGTWSGSQTVVLEDESADAAREWYYSNSYQAAAKIRREAADCNAVIISGSR